METPFARAFINRMGFSGGGEREVLYDLYQNCGNKAGIVAVLYSTRTRTLFRTLAEPS